MNVFLIGYRCTGKTTIGRILSDYLNFSFTDLDQAVENENGSSIASIVASYGWDKFRELEQNALFKLENTENIVVSTGGGIILDSDNRNFLMKSGFVVYLFAEINIILKRLVKDASALQSRPSLTNYNLKKETEILIKEREPLYSEIADIKVDTSFKTPEQLADRIKRRIINDRE